MPPPLSLYRGQGNNPFNTSQPQSAAKRGQTVPYDVNGAPAGGAIGARFLDISVTDLPSQSPTVPLLRFRLQQNWSFGAGVADSAIAATGSAVFSIRKNGSQVGTVTFAGSTGTVAFVDSTFPSGSLFEIYPPATANATLDDVSITIGVTVS